MRLKLSAWRAPDDPEKCVTPAIVFISKGYGFMVALGWWNFAVGLFVCFHITTQEEE